MEPDVKRASLAALIALVLSGGVTGGTMATAAGIVSLNLCTDQLLLDLAPHERIAGLSPYARQGLAPGAALPAPAFSGTAEEVMVMRPALVVSGRFMKRATAEFIRTRGIALEEFDFVRSLGEARAQIRRFGEITGAQDKAHARIIEIDAAIDTLRIAARDRPGLMILPYSRRGWVSGEKSLMGDILREVGLGNGASALGLQAGGFAKLEQIIALRPDALLMAREEGTADQGQALLAHPALAALYPPDRRILIAERLANCGGPALAGAILSLAQQVSRLAPRK
jgi:iron complex transport system substrate-binding protein